MENTVYERLGEKTEKLYMKLDHMQKEGWQSQLLQQMKETESRILKLAALYEKVEKGQLLQEQSREIQALWKDYQTFVKDANARFQILVTGSESTGQFPFGFYDKQLDMLKGFQKRLQKICQSNAAVLRKHLQQYDDIQMRIDQAAERRRKQFAAECGAIKEQYRSIYYANVKQNVEFINTIDNVSNDQWQAFLKDKIIKNNQIQDRLDKMYENACQDLAEEFDVLQKGCLVGDYQPEWTVFHKFRREAEKYTGHSRTLQRNVERMTTETGGVDVGKRSDSAENWLGKFMGGESGIRRKVNSLLTRWTMTPLERTRKMVDAILDDICGEYQLEDILKEYTSSCQALCAESMKGLCATWENTDRICTQLKDIPGAVSKKGIQQVGLAEMLCTKEK